MPCHNPADEMQSDRILPQFLQSTNRQNELDQKG
jgi:hypothetical protein